MDDDTLDPLWTAAVQQQESGGDPNAVSSKGAIGTMQTLPTTLSNPGYGVTPAKDNSDAERQRVGQDYLQALNNKYGDRNLALMAYNWGPGNVNNWIKNGQNPSDLPNETKDYVQKVNQIYQQSKKLPAGTQMASNDTYANDAAASSDPLDEYISAGKNSQQSTALPPATVHDDSQDDPNHPPLKITINPVKLSTAKKSPSDPLDEYIAAGQNDKSSQPSAQTQEKPTISTAEDLALTAPSSAVKGINAIVQPAYLGNAIANTMGEAAYGINRLAGAPKDDALYNRLTNINPFFTGNTIADTALQTGNALLGNPAPANPLTSSVIHDPQTPAGRFENALIQGIMAGKAGGGENVLAKGGEIALPTASLPKIVGGALGAQTASEVFPGSPSAQLAGGFAGYKAGEQVSPNPLSPAVATLYKNSPIKVPTTIMTGGKNLLEGMAGKADTSEMEATANKTAADLIGANDNGGNHTLLNKDSFAEAKKNNIAEINRVDSSIGDVPTGTHLNDIESEILGADQKRFYDLSNEIDAAKNPNGTISASAIRSLTGFGSNLSRWANSATEDLREPAQAIIKSLKAMIKDNATPQQLEDLTTVNNKYKLMSDFETIANESGIDNLTKPSVIRDTINNSYDKTNDYKTPAKNVGNLLNQALPGRSYVGKVTSAPSIFNQGNNFTHAEILGSLLSAHPIAGLAMIAAPKFISKGAAAITNSKMYRNSLLQNAQ